LASRSPPRDRDAKRTRTITISSVQPEQEDNSASAAAAAAAPPAEAGRDGAGAPYLPDKYIRQFAKKYSDVAATELEKTGDVDRTALDRWVRASFAKLGVPPQSVEVDFNRVMAVLSTLH
jgi:hypothetical protein